MDGYDQYAWNQWYAQHEMVYPPQQEGNGYGDWRNSEYNYQMQQVPSNYQDWRNVEVSPPLQETLPSYGQAYAPQVGYEYQGAGEGVCYDDRRSFEYNYHMQQAPSHYQEWGRNEDVYPSNECQPQQTYDPSSISSSTEESETRIHEMLALLLQKADEMNEKLDQANARMGEQIQQSESSSSTSAQLGSYMSSSYEESLTYGANVDIEIGQEEEEEEKEEEECPYEDDEIEQEEKEEEEGPCENEWDVIISFVEERCAKKDVNYWNAFHESFQDFLTKRFGYDKDEELIIERDEEDEDPSYAKNEEEERIFNGDEEECPSMDMSEKEQEDLEAPKEELESQMSISKPLNSSICISIDSVASYDFILPLIVSNLNCELKKSLGILELKSVNEKKEWRNVYKPNVCKKGTEKWPNYHKGLLDVEAKRMRYNGKEDRYPWPFR